MFSKGFTFIAETDVGGLIKNLSAIVKEMEEEGTEEAIELLISESIKANIVSLYRKAFFAALNAILGLKGKNVKSVLDIPNDLPNVAALLQCDIIHNGKLYKFAGPLKSVEEIVLKFTEDTYIIQAKKHAQAANHELYVEEKTKIKAELCKILLCDKENHFNALENLGNLRELDVQSIIVSLENLKKCDWAFSELKKLREGQKKKGLSKLMVILKRIIKRLKEQMKCVEAIKELNADIGYVIKEENAKTYDSCNECGKNEKEYKKLTCGHIFCPDCGKAHLEMIIKKCILPKCPIPYCFYIMNEDEKKALYQSEVELKDLPSKDSLDYCVFCGKKKGLKKYDKKHKMCENCLKEYADYQCHGNIFLCPEDKSKVKEIKCPCFNCKYLIDTNELISCYDQADRDAMLKNAFDSKIHQSSVESEDVNEEQKEDFKKKEPKTTSTKNRVKCFMEDCQAREKELRKLSSCKSNCDIFTCQTHQKELAGLIGENNGKLLLKFYLGKCNKCNEKCLHQELKKLKNCELGMPEESNLLPLI